jgi:hypothetical protein
MTRYFDVTVDGKTNRDAAWYYPRPSTAATRIRGYVAFWQGVRVERVVGPESAESSSAPHQRSLWQRMCARLRPDTA